MLALLAENSVNAFLQQKSFLQQKRTRGISIALLKGEHEFNATEATFLEERIEKKLEKKFQKSLDDLNETVMELKAKLSVAQTDIDGFYQAFYPASLYGMLETITKLAIKDEFLIIHPHESVEGATMHHYLSMSSQLVSVLFSPSHSPKQILSVKKKKLENIEKNTRENLAVNTLFAIASFVKAIEVEAKDWPPERNILLHNGRLLEALFGIDVGQYGLLDPNKTMNESDSKHTPAEMRRLWDTLFEALKKFKPKNENGSNDNGTKVSITDGFKKIEEVVTNLPREHDFHLTPCVGNLFHNDFHLFPRRLRHISNVSPYCDPLWKFPRRL